MIYFAYNLGKLKIFLGGLLRYTVVHILLAIYEVASRIARNMCSRIQHLNYGFDVVS